MLATEDDDADAEDEGLRGLRRVREGPEGRPPRDRGRAPPVREARRPGPRGSREVGQRVLDGPRGSRGVHALRARLRAVRLPPRLVPRGQGRPARRQREVRALRPPRRRRRDRRARARAAPARSRSLGAGPVGGGAEAAEATALTGYGSGANFIVISTPWPALAALLLPTML